MARSRRPSRRRRSAPSISWKSRSACRSCCRRSPAHSRPPRRASRGAARFPRWGPAPRYARLRAGLLAARRPLLALGEPGAGHEVVARALELSGAPFVALPTGARLASNPLQLIEEAREGVLYCADIGQYSRAEQKGLAFLLPKLDKHHIVLVATS